MAATHVVWSASDVSPAQRRQVLGQQGCVVWFTGLSGSGKSTICRNLEVTLVAAGRAAYILDGDNLRHGLCRDLGFSSSERSENIRRVAEVANLMADAGLIVLTAFISPYRADRAAARALVTRGPFFEVFVDTPLEVCEQRDPKGLYRRARAGQIPSFTGISDPYEIPEQPELRLPTSDQTPAVCVERVLALLHAQEILPPQGC